MKYNAKSKRVQSVSVTPSSQGLSFLGGLFAIMIIAIVLMIVIPDSGKSTPVKSNTDAPTSAVKEESFCFDAESHGVYIGDTRYAGLVNVPEQAVNWSSSDTNVATVDSEGNILGLNEGQTIITAERKDGSKCTLTVNVQKKTFADGLDLPTNYFDKLIVVNTNNPIGADYVPELVKVRAAVPTAHVGSTFLTPECEEALSQLYTEFVKQGLGKLMLISTYRSYEKQASLLQSSIDSRMKKGMSEEAARADALKTRQAPGCSEHQLGLSIDFSTNATTQHDFHETKQGKWLTENAWKYGFVLRYPSSKAKLTGIDYEPWHFRYVGLDHAKYIYEHGLCVEEYVQLQQEAEDAANAYAAKHPLD